MKLGRIGSHRANGCAQELWGELIGIDLDQTAHIAIFELEKWLNRAKSQLGRKKNIVRFVDQLEQEKIV
jgi:hypothetical protein